MQFRSGLLGLCRDIFALDPGDANPECVLAKSALDEGAAVDIYRSGPQLEIIWKDLNVTFIEGGECEVLRDGAKCVAPP